MPQKARYRSVSSEDGSVMLLSGMMRSKIPQTLKPQSPDTPTSLALTSLEKGKIAARRF